MSVKIKDLVKLLQTKDQNKPVEFLVVGEDDGQVVCMRVDGNVNDVAKAISLFGTKGRK